MVVYDGWRISNANSGQICDHYYFNLLKISWSDSSPLLLKGTSAGLGFVLQRGEEKEMGHGLGSVSHAKGVVGVLGLELREKKTEGIKGLAAPGILR